MKFPIVTGDPTLGTRLFRKRKSRLSRKRFSFPRESGTQGKETPTDKCKINLRNTVTFGAKNMMILGNFKYCVSFSVSSAGKIGFSWHSKLRLDEFLHQGSVRGHFLSITASFCSAQANLKASISGIFTQRKFSENWTEPTEFFEGPGEIEVEHYEKLLALSILVVVVCLHVSFIRNRS